MRALGARGVVYLETFGPDSAQCGAAIENLRAQVDAARRGDVGLVEVLSERLRVAAHIAESAEEVSLVTRADGPFAQLLRDRGIPVEPRGESPIAVLARTGLLETRPLCIHAVHVSHDDVARIAGAGASVAHCPRANTWFAPDQAPVASLRAAGVRVGLGTDSLGNNDDVRVLAEAVAAADTTLPDAERIALATVGGARALAMDAVVGTLEPGKYADIAAFPIADTHACDADPSRYVLQHATRSPARLTLVAGAVRARDGYVAGADAGLAARVTTHRERVAAWFRRTGVPEERDSRFRP
jgi:5-methylthioadenosine/S-adenosylhomocysteine deaminase